MTPNVPLIINVYIFNAGNLGLVFIFAPIQGLSHGISGTLEKARLNSIEADFHARIQANIVM